MNRTKTLMLAGLAALSLGAGAANARNLTPTGEVAYFEWQSNAAPSFVTRGGFTGQGAAEHFGSSGHAGTGRVSYFDDLFIRGGF
jgi:hypothetical protein